jgi:hypothetical protein
MNVRILENVMTVQRQNDQMVASHVCANAQHEWDKCEEFLHTFHTKICTHKTHLGVELLYNCSLTNKAVQCNVMKFTKNLMCCVHLKKKNKYVSYKGFFVKK